TKDLEPTRLDLSEHDKTVQQVRIAKPTRSHQVLLEHLRPNSLYSFRLHAREGRVQLRTRPYELDTHFDFSTPQVPPQHAANANPDQRLLEGRSLDEPGLAIVFGAGDTAKSIATGSPLRVLVIEDDPGRVDEARSQWIDQGLYGRRLSILGSRQDARGLPARIADLVTFDTSIERPAEAAVIQAARLVQPNGVLAVPASVQPGELPQWHVLPSHEHGNLRIARGQPIEGAAPWSHMYGGPDNSAYAGETLGGAEQFGELDLQWAGRPGPRYQSDRGNRKPSPLAANGRLFMQGLDRVIAVDAYNGIVLWELGLPELRRFNVPRDCSNWCTDGTQLFLATADRATVLDAATGRIDATIPVPAPTKGFHWGFIAREADLLVGSTVAAEAPFTEYWGSEHWYDTKDGPLAAKVCSDSIFALDAESGEMAWSRSEGLVVNSTITITPDSICFLECRDPLLRAEDNRRLTGERFWKSLHLVALDLETGKPRWERPAEPVPGTSLVAMVAAEGRLVLQTSNTGVFAVYVFNAETGEMEWRSNYKWETDHHGKHLSRPLVVEGRMYLRPLTIDLATGEVLASTFPEGHQCGTYTASRDALFLRAGEMAMWDRDSGSATRLSRVRPDCWISSIPAEGMLLSPEGGGGCSCGSWMETSMGLLPRRSADPEPAP
ncbi:MAG: PQQ-like beta-propeller repeat protein, partial [Phycisphaerales bacterium]|nr:PQQ-like beta-propeller repeat protein [Phycisphaerales bacterium]